MNTSVIPKQKLIPKKLFAKIQQSIPIATIDLAILRRRKTNGLEILLIKRKIFPEINKWCLIGGRILKGERFKDTIDRQMEREFGANGTVIKPWSPDKPLAVWNEPKVDVQKHFVCMIYPLTLRGKITLSSGPEWSEAKWFSIRALPSPLGFNHKKEIRTVISLVRRSGRKF